MVIIDEISVRFGDDAEKKEREEEDRGWMHFLELEVQVDYFGVLGTTFYCKPGMRLLSVC